MGIFNSKSHLLLLLLFSFSVFTYNPRICSSQRLMLQNPLKEITCTSINCGEGKCMDSTSSTLGFECECNPGWKKIQIRPIAFPSCLIPDCTIDFQCGNGIPLPPPPPRASPLIPPSINFSDPCVLTWCGDGKCVTNGIGHTCEWYQGSTNLFNNSAFACFKQCYLGVDCNRLGVGLPLPPPPARPTILDWRGNASYDMEPIPTSTAAASSSSSKLQVLALIMLAATTITWY